MFTWWFSPIPLQHYKSSTETLGPSYTFVLLFPLGNDNKVSREIY